MLAIIPIGLAALASVFFPWMLGTYLLLDEIILPQSAEWNARRSRYVALAAAFTTVFILLLAANGKGISWAAGWLTVPMTSWTLVAVGPLGLRSPTATWSRVARGVLLASITTWVVMGHNSGWMLIAAASWVVLSRLGSQAGTARVEVTNE
jgi:hypothetical protein